MLIGQSKAEHSSVWHWILTYMVTKKLANCGKSQASRRRKLKLIENALGYAVFLLIACYLLKEASLLAFPSLNVPSSLRTTHWNGREVNLRWSASQHFSRSKIISLTLWMLSTTSIQVCGGRWNTLKGLVPHGWPRYKVY